MSLRINQNVLSMSTHGMLAQTSGRLEKSIQKLSSGLRINSAADDAAGLSISEKMRRQIRGLSRATLNAQDGVSMIQTAEGALNESHSILQRMRELAIQSSNDTLTSGDRLEIQKEVTQLKDDLNRISRNTEFNTKKLLDGSQTALLSSTSGAIRSFVTGSVDGGTGDYDISIALLRGGASQMMTSQIFSIEGAPSKLADGGTELQSISQFYDANGVFVLDTPQTLTVNGKGLSTTVQLDGQMSLDNVAAAIQNSLVSKSGVGIENSRVAIINTVQTEIAGLGGYMEVISGDIGETGEVSFSGDQKIIDALGLSISRESVNSRLLFTTKDGFGNVRTATTESNKATGLLGGVDMEFDSQSAQVAGTSGMQEGLNITVAGSLFTVSAGGTQVTITIPTGAWSMEGLATSMQLQIDASNAGAGIPGLKTSVVEGELRFSYDKPATAANTVPSSIDISNVQGQATRLGFLQGTYSGFVDGKRDKNASVWGFSSYIDTAASGLAAGQNVIFTIGDGNTSNTTIEVTAYTTIGDGISLASDLVVFTNFQATVNQILDAATVAVRVDQIGGAMSFTSLRVGTENRNNLAALTSMVSLTVTATNAVMQNVALHSFGFTAGTFKGAGDKNFRLHVVDNSPQFQIGADQGQTMSLTIGNMSSLALGVDSLDLTTTRGASSAISKLNKAIDKVSAERSKLGAYQNRLEHSINNLRNTHSNLTAAESRIRDADIAQEMIEFTRNQIVSQAGTAMLAQANAIPQGVLQLLK